MVVDGDGFSFACEMLADDRSVERNPVESFYLSKEGVTFYYNVYDITPYAMGPVKVTVPFPMMEHLLGSNPILGELKD